MLAAAQNIARLTASPCFHLNLAAAATSLGRRLSLGSGEVTLDCLESVDAGGESRWAICFVTASFGTDAVRRGHAGLPGERGCRP